MIFPHRVKINGVHYPAGVDVPVEEKVGAVEQAAPVFIEPEEPKPQTVKKPEPQKRGRTKK